MKTNFLNFHLEKIKINIKNDEFWHVPSSLKLFTPRKRNFIIKKANSLDEIYEQNNLSVGNYYFSFNRDHDFKLFNKLQSLSALKNLKINKKVEKEIETKGHYIFDYSNKIKLFFDEKNLYKIFRGNSFLINENYFEKYVDYLKQIGHKNDQWIFYWNGSSFKLK